MSGTDVTGKDFQNSDGNFRWRELGRRFVTSYLLAIGSLVAGLAELLFGLLASAYEMAYDGYEALLGLPFRGWEGLIEAAWLAAGRSIAGSFGLVAWLVAVVVITVFFYIVARALRTAAKGVTP